MRGVVGGEGEGVGRSSTRDHWRGGCLRLGGMGEGFGARVMRGTVDIVTLSSGK